MARMLGAGKIIATDISDYKLDIAKAFGADVVFNANAFVSQYCAHKDTEIASISKEDMEALLTANKDKLYSFAFTDEEREIPPEQGDEDSGETIHETIRIYTISYNGEAYFADQSSTCQTIRNSLQANMRKT